MSTKQGTRPRYSQTKGDAVVEDLEFLVVLGVGHQEAARRVGYSEWTTLYRLLERRGRLGLAGALVWNHFDRQGFPETVKPRGIGEHIYPYVRPDWRQ